MITRTDLDMADAARQAVTALRTTIARAEAEIEGCRARIRAEQSVCPHPRAFDRSLMGRETVRWCPDCEWSS